MKTHYIDTKKALQEFCAEIANCSWLAIDTEFMREKTFYPELCLIQIGTSELTACIDPLRLDDLDDLLDVLYNKDITKVVHAGGQDMEIFYHLRGELPQPIFDTQLAAPLLGHPEQAGYARLVEDILGVNLKKIHTRADWAHRPLTAAQIEYAADDVIYLVKIYQILLDQLQQRQRLSWLDADFSHLTDPRRYENLPELAWKRVKSVNRLRGSQLSTLQVLAEWREQRAQQENIPRGWLIKDDVLIDMAKQRPSSLETLGRVRGLSDRTVKRRGQELLDIIQSGMQQQPQPLPEHIKSKKLNHDQEAVVDLMSALVHIRATENDLNPALLVSRKQLQKIAGGEGIEETLSGWRYKILGAELQNLLDGNTCIGLDQGKLKFVTTELIKKE
jgi:ribonuclease D